MSKEQKLQDTIDKLQKELDVAKASLENLAEETYSIADRFVCEGDKHILARTDGHVVNFIGLTDGNRWSDGRKVKDARRITQRELDSICGHHTFVRYWDNRKKILYKERLK